MVWRYQSSQSRKVVLSEEELSSTVRQKTIEKEKSHLKELREITESLTETTDKTEKSEVKFRRRR